MRQNELSDKLNHWNYISQYSTWMYHKYEAYIGKKVFDVGAGMGRIVKYYIERCEQIVATDIFQSQIDYMNDHYNGYPCFGAVLLDILMDDISPYENRFDTVICINVLEHLDNDRLAVKKMQDLLCVNGYLILIVPAFEKLYCQLDKNVGHHRRYDKGILRDIVESCNLQIIDNIYFNALGIIPYYIKGKMKVKENESFSTTLNEYNGKIYNLASKILEPIEKHFPPPFGLSEIIIAQKLGSL